MGLKPIPYELPEKTFDPSGAPIKNLKLKNRLSKTKKSPANTTVNQKLLNRTCSKILNFLDTKAKKSLVQINELETLLHRSVLSLQKEKRALVDKKAKNK